MSVPARRLSGSSAFGRRAAVRLSRGAEASRRWRSMQIFYLGLIARRPDLTLDEAVLAMHRHKIPGSRSAMWRFFNRRNVTFKKRRRTDDGSGL